MPSETWKIVIVDDSPEDRAEVRRLLLSGAERRFTFAEAESGEEGIRLCLQPDDPPHCLFVDFNLPDMDAYEVLKRLRQPDGSLLCPVVVLTGSIAHANAKTVLRAGAQDFLGKGWIGVESIARAAENAVERWRMSRELQQRQRALGASERFNRTVLDSSPDCVKILSPEGKLLNINIPGLSLLEIDDVTPFTGREWVSMWPGHLQPVVRSALQGAQQGRTERFQGLCPTAKGMLKWWDVIVAPIRNEEGEVVKLLATSRDITEQKAAEEDLHQAKLQAEAASRSKDQFIATLSHELRNPLNPVLLVASDALSEPNLSEEARAAWRLVQKNVSLEAALIDDLLDLTRIEQGKVTLASAQRNAHAILNDAIETVQLGMTEKNQLLERHFEATKATVLVDSVRLQQVFWNVLNNAVKFTPPGGRISVRTRNPGGDRLRIEISDNGIGMTHVELARVFDAFSQGEHADGAVRRYGGLGLGMAITRQLVEMHGGVIQASSPGRDGGAVFIIELPLCGAVAVAPQPVESNAGGTRATNKGSKGSFARAASPGEDGHPWPKILLVEDDEVTRSTLTRLLKRRGYQPQLAGSVTEARQLARDQTFDLVISDLGLEDGDGHSLMVELRTQQGPHLRGIALSGYGMPTDVARSMEAGFSVHLTKPVQIQALERALHEVLSPLVMDGE